MNNIPTFETNQTPVEIVDSMNIIHEKFQHQLKSITDLDKRDKPDEDASKIPVSNTGLPPFATNENQQCMNKVSHRRCSMEFLMRGSCTSNTEFDFQENCQKYCEFCVKVPGSIDGDSRTDQSFINNGDQIIHAELSPFEEQSEESMKSNSTFLAEKIEEKKGKLLEKSNQPPSLSPPPPCVNKASYFKCSVQFLIYQTCDNNKNNQQAFDFYKNCQQYCEFCVVDLSAAVKEKLA